VLLVSDGRVAGYVRGPADPVPTEPKRSEVPGAPRSLWRRLFGRK